METLWAIVAGVLFASGFYMLMRRNLIKIYFGLSLIGNAGNLLIFTSGGLTRAVAPVIPAGATSITGTYADPLPQALILTAIVIGFGIQAFTLILLWRSKAVTAKGDADDLRTTDITEKHHH